VVSQRTITNNTETVIFPLMEIEIGMEMENIFRQEWKVKMEIIFKWN
jgi:hypothetical protein